MLLFSVFSQLRSEYRICFLWSTSFNWFNCLYSPPNSECWTVPLVERTKTADGARLICACSWLLKQLGYLIPNGGFVYCKVSNCCMLFLLISKAVRLSKFSGTFWNMFYEKCKNPLVFHSVLHSKFSSQSRWQLWEKSSLICIHVIEVILSVLTVCREYCLPVIYSGIQFGQAPASLFPLAPPKWSQPVFNVNLGVLSSCKLYSKGIKA